jgi:hypothetical protein
MESRAALIMPRRWSHCTSKRARLRENDSINIRWSRGTARGNGGRNYQASTMIRQLPIFDRYVGIDYSGAQTPTSSLKGLRLYIADRASEAREVPPPPSPRKYWTRREVAEWLVEYLRPGAQPTLVGIDHGFSFPIDYFDKYGLPHDWPAFLDDFHSHWPTDGENKYVDFIRNGYWGNGSARSGKRN